MVEEIAVSFFSLLENILRTEHLSSTSMVCSHLRVSHKLQSASWFWPNTMPTFWSLSWRIKFNCGSRLQPAPSTCGFRLSRVGLTWFFKPCSFLQERRKVSRHCRKYSNVQFCCPPHFIHVFFPHILYLLIRWHDGTPQRLFSICGIFRWHSAVEVDWYEGSTTEITGWYSFCFSIQINSLLDNFL